MKAFSLAIVFALGMGLSSVQANDATCIACNPAPRMEMAFHGGGAELSVMTLNVKKVGKSPKSAQEFKEQLMKLPGIESVSNEKDIVTVKYDKAKLGCCSKIHSSLKDAGWKYELVSNVENPACSHGSKGKMCPNSAKKEKGA